MKEESLPTTVKLKSKKQIASLFENGTSIKAYPLLLAYQEVTLDTPFKIGFSVSKRNFKHAVKRNRIKRLLREYFRKNKYLFTKSNQSQFLFMLIYIGNTTPTYNEVAKAMEKLVKKWETNR